MAQAKVIDNNVGDQKTSIDLVNDSSVKRLLRLKRITGAQIGRILFLNVCEMLEGRQQLYTYTEYSDLIKKLDTEDEIKDFIFYQRLTTYAVNEVNELMIRNSLSLKGLKYIHSEIRLCKLDPTHELDHREINSTINDIRLNLQYINSYALFYDAVKKLLRDPRLKSKYRITNQARQVIKEAEKYDKYLFKHFNKIELEKLKLFPIGETPRIYIDHKPRPITITKIIDYLKVVFDPSVNIGNVTTSNVAKYLNNNFPRD